MRKILDIKVPVGHTHIVWEHLMKSIFAFAGMFALLFFGPLFLESRKRGQRINKEGGVGRDILIYMLEHPEIQFLLCGLSVIAYNGYLIFKNTRKKYVVSLVVVESSVEVGITNLYYQNTITKTVSISDLSYIIESKKTDLNEKKQTLKFINTSNGNVVGLIKPKHFIWNEQLPEIKRALSELAQLGVKKG